MTRRRDEQLVLVERVFTTTDGKRFGVVRARPSISVPIPDDVAEGDHVIITIGDHRFVEVVR